MVVKTTIRTPMPIKMRAKQFAMFDAMKGLTEAIAEKERQICIQRELTEDRIQEINQCVLELNAGDCVEVTYYCQYEKKYKKTVGVVNKINYYWKELQIGNMQIDFSEIFTLEVIRSNQKK